MPPCGREVTHSALFRDGHVTVSLVACPECLREPSPTRSSGSIRAASRSRRTCSAACRRSRSSGWPTARARRRRSAFAAASPRPSSSGRCAGSPSTSRRPSCARRAPGSTCRSRSRCSRRRASSHRARSPGTRRSASSLSTGGCGRYPARSRPPRARAGTGRPGWSARPSPRPRSRSPGSSPSPVRHLAEAVAYLRGERDPPPPEPAARRSRVARARPRRRPRPGAGAAWRSRSPPQAGTTCCSRARRAPARRCSPAACPGILPPLEPEAALEVTRIHSVAGLLPPERPLIETPPFRAPHHSASTAAIVGGGARRGPARRASPTAACCCSTSCPSSRGRRSRRCASRSRTATSRSRAPAGGRSSRPAFSSSATMNLCPCGARGDPAVECTCSPQRLDALPRQALARAARPLRPRRRACRGRARRRARRGARRGVRAPSGSVSSRRGSGSRAAPLARRAEARRAARRARSSGCRSRGAAGPAWRASRGRSPRSPARRRSLPEHVAEALAYRSPSELRCA